MTITPALPPMPLTTAKVRPPTAAAAGKVTTQVTTIRPNTIQRTGCARPSPAPTTEPEHTWVVDSGMPK